MTRLFRAYPWLLLSPVVLPVVIWGGFIYPYLVPKTLLFYGLSFATLASFVLLVAYGHAFYWQRLKHKEFWIPAALLVLAYATSLTGLGFYHSFWSYFVRGDGLLTLSGVVTFFYLILLSADRLFLERLVRAVAVVGSFVALYGIGEWLVGGGRIGSLLGNAAFFAGDLGIALFATLAAAPTLARPWRRAAYVGALLQVVAIILSATRGTMLALGMAVLVALGYLAFKGEGGRRRVAIGALSALVIAGGLFYFLRAELSHVPFAPIQRIATIGTNDPDVASRLFIWRHMLGAVAQHPLLGVGAEHIDVPFNSFYDPTQIAEQWFDRSHNAYLDYAVQYGLLGLVLYLALLALFFLTAYRLSVRGERLRAGLLSLLVITYGVQNFFVFDTVSSFWLLLALLAGFGAYSLEEGAPRALTLPHSARSGSWVLAVLFGALIVPVVVYPAIAAYDLMQAYLYQRVDVPKETTYLSHGFALGTYADVEYGYEAYDIYANEQAVNLTGDARVEAYQAALAVLTKDFNRYPYDARTALYLAHVLSLAPPEVSVDNGLLSSALERAIRLSPKRSQPWYILVNLSLTEANTNPALSSARIAGYAASKDILQRYIALVPALSEPYYVLAQLDRTIGDSATAVADAAKGRQYYREDLETARRAAGYYEGVEDWKNAAFFLREVVRLAPFDNASRYDLAKVTYLTGDAAGAEALVAQLRQSDPSILTTDQNFMAAITAYERSIQK